MTDPLLPGGGILLITPTVDTAPARASLTDVEQAIAWRGIDRRLAILQDTNRRARRARPTTPRHAHTPEGPR